MGKGLELLFLQRKYTNKHMETYGNTWPINIWKDAQHHSLLDECKIQNMKHHLTPIIKNKKQQKTTMLARM